MDLPSLGQPVVEDSAVIGVSTVVRHRRAAIVTTPSSRVATHNDARMVAAFMDSLSSPTRRHGDLSSEREEKVLLFDESTVMADRGDLATS